MLIRGLPVDELPTPRPVTGWANGIADLLDNVFTTDELAALAVAAAGGPDMAAGRGCLVAQAIVSAPGGPWARLSNILAVAAHRSAGRAAEAQPAT